MVRQAPVICVMAPPIHLGAWSMALMLWLPFELLLLFMVCYTSKIISHLFHLFQAALHKQWRQASSVRFNVIFGELGSPSYHSHNILNP